MKPVSPAVQRLSLSLVTLALLSSPALAKGPKAPPKSAAAEAPAAAPAPGGPPAIMVKLKPTIVQEMVVYQAQMNQLLLGIISGDHALVASSALALNDGPMKKVPEADKKELAKVVPAEFFKINTGMHQAAGRMAEAAQKQDQKAELSTYAEIVQGCHSCHAQFAVKRFPGFKAGAPAPMTAPAPTTAPAP